MAVKRAAEALMEDDTTYEGSVTIVSDSPPLPSSGYELAQMPDFLLNIQLPAYVPYQNCPEADMNDDPTYDASVTTLHDSPPATPVYDATASTPEVDAQMPGWLSVELFGYVQPQYRLEDDMIMTDDEESESTPVEETNEGANQSGPLNSPPAEITSEDTAVLDDSQARRARVEADFESSRLALTRPNILPFVRGGLAALYRFISLSTGIRHESTERFGFRGEGTVTFDERTFKFEFEPSRAPDFHRRICRGAFADHLSYSPDHFYKESESQPVDEKEERELRFPDAMYSCARTLDEVDFDIESSFHKLRLIKQCWDRARQDLAEERVRRVVAKRDAYERALALHAREAEANENDGKPKVESNVDVQEDTVMTGTASTLPATDLNSLTVTADMPLQLRIMLRHHQKLPANVQRSNTPTLLGMPDGILRQIFRHVTDLPKCQDLWRSGHDMCGAPLAPLPGENDETATPERLHARVPPPRQLMFERYTAWGRSIETEIEAAARANSPKDDGVLRPKDYCHHRPDPEDWRSGQCMFLNNAFYHQLARAKSDVRRMQRRVLGIRVGNHGSSHETDPKYLVQFEDNEVPEEAKQALAMARSQFKQI